MRQLGRGSGKVFAIRDDGGAGDAPDLRADPSDAKGAVDGDLEALLAPPADERAWEAPRRRRPRYSQLVSWGKIALPAVAVVLAALVVIWPQLERAGDDAFSIGIASIGRRSVNMEQVVNARFFGTDTDRQPYSVTADLAEETAPGSHVVRLDHPQADLTLNDGSWVMLSAQQGLFHQQTSLLELSDQVSLYHDQGYELHTDQATIDMPLGKAEGKSPVQAQGPFGTLLSEGFVIDRQAKTVTFTGKAYLTLREGAADPAPASTPSQ